MTSEIFLAKITDFYSRNSRSMPWRISDNGVYDPYKIVVSEIMLQQTQVDRVIPKFNTFIGKFPDIQSLAAAELQEVLALWSGLGYNRRAKYLHDFARQVATLNEFPDTIQALAGYKGIGPNTAAAILVYTFNEPHIFIETNIRTVYINCFFQDKESVTDNDIASKLVATIDKNNPREFYWGLMDYGTFLKKQGKGSLKKSQAHKKQSKFAGSVRELRGRVIKQLTQSSLMTESDLQTFVQDERLREVLVALEKENMIRIDKKNISIA